MAAGVGHGNGDRVEGALHDDRRRAAGEQIAGAWCRPNSRLPLW